MTTKNFIFIISILLIIILSMVIYWKTYEVKIGGSCDYEKFTDTVKVDNILYIGDSIDYINLKSTVSSHYYQMDSWELSFHIGKDFTEKEIKNSINRFYIIEERITYGACTPYSIKQMKLIKK